MNEYAWSDGTKPERSYKKDNPELNPKQIALSDDWDDNIGNTKREEAYIKIKERELIGRVGTNPFLNKTSYSEDIEIQQNYLIPQNSNIGK